MALKFIMNLYSTVDSFIDEGLEVVDKQLAAATVVVKLLGPDVGLEVLVGHHPNSGFHILLVQPENVRDLP